MRISDWSSDVCSSDLSEYDDRPGPLHDQVQRQQQRWMGILRGATQLAIDEAHLRPGDTEQYAFELYAIALNVHHQSGLFGQEQAEQIGRASCRERVCQ